MSPPPGCRFIPAWAGNTVSSGAISRRNSVHPRVGGEHFRVPRRGGGFFGSSPRGRGTLSRAAAATHSHRFIPAWAGNTLSGHPIGQPGLLVPSVHPRVGGEHSPAACQSSNAVGSSPRGRGTRNLGIHRLHQFRFIPAWAGNTDDLPAMPPARPVHPRVGGEHTVSGDADAPLAGSSPRGRGTLPRLGRAAQYRRFIPAWAGNTPSRRSPQNLFSVHPRVGGEHIGVVLAGALLFGSSPRGRGTLAPRHVSRV